MSQHNHSIIHSGRFDERKYFRKEHVFTEKQQFAESLFIYILSVVEIPAMLLTLLALCFLIKSQRGASVFVVHLILSDLIQIICILITITESSGILESAYVYCLIVGLFFMACIAFERYLLVSHPHWYKSNQSLKLSCFISAIIWFVPLIFADIIPPPLHFRDPYQSIACLIPYPIIILCFVGTCRGLSHSVSLTALKRKLILGSMFLVLLTYTFLIFPFVIYDLINHNITVSILNVKIYLFLKYLMYLNPLADCLLYLFMRADANNIMKPLGCCCRIDELTNGSSV